MGDLGIDTEVRALGDDRYEATLSQEWEIWGPMGGYVAACALRAAGASSPFDRPATFSCHFLSVAKFGTVDIRVETRKGARTATSQRVEVTQDDRAILDATVWSIGDVEGLEHDETVAPEVPGPDGLPFIQELLPDDAQPPFPFWNNFDAKPLAIRSRVAARRAAPARWAEWLRFLPTPTFADPWTDAARSVILVDLPSWPSAHRPHAWTEPPFIAPTLDLNVAFHQPASDEEWLLCDGAAPLSTSGLFAWTSRVWSPGGRLHASGGGQCLYRRMRG